jgi:hypothetical protein
MFNVQQLAWHPAEDPDPHPVDLFNFQKLKRFIQKLDAVHKVGPDSKSVIHCKPMAASCVDFAATTCHSYLLYCCCCL